VERRRPDPAERKELLARVAQGDRRARELLLEQHLGLVLAVARERAKAGEQALSSADLFQEGTVGLLAAIDAYATSGLGDFETFARAHIASEMAAAEAAEGDAQQQGREMVAAAEAYERAEFEVRREHGRQATIEELAHRLGWTEERTEEVAMTVDAARRQHDEDLLEYLDAEDVSPEELQSVLEQRAADEDVDSESDAGPSGASGPDR
jgi:DNA-directed RNA polymerase specialized sigma subunit